MRTLPLALAAACLGLASAAFPQEGPEAYLASLESVVKDCRSFMRLAGEKTLAGRTSLAAADRARLKTACAGLAKTLERARRFPRFEVPAPVAVEAERDRGLVATGLAGCRAGDQCPVGSALKSDDKAAAARSLKTAFKDLDRAARHAAAYLDSPAYFCAANQKHARCLPSSHPCEVSPQGGLPEQALLDEIEARDCRNQARRRAHDLCAGNPDAELMLGAELSGERCLVYLAPS